MKAANLAASLAAVILTSACAEPPAKPIPEASRRSIVAVSGDVSGQKQSDTSTLGARGSNEGAKLGAEDGASRVPPAGPIGIVAKIASAAVGGVKGASEAQREEVVDEVRASLRRAIDETDFTELLRAKLAASKSAGDVAIVGVTSPASASKSAGDVAIVGVTSPASAASVNATAAGHIVALDYRLDLHRRNLVNPSVGVQVLVKAEVRDPARGQTVHEASWAYCGERTDFVRMAADNAAQLRAQIDRAASVLAEAIPYDLYVSRQPRPLQSSKPQCMDFSDLPSGIERTVARS